MVCTIKSIWEPSEIETHKQTIVTYEKIVHCIRKKYEKEQNLLQKNGLVNYYFSNQPKCSYKFYREGNLTYSFLITLYCVTYIVVIKKYQKFIQHI